MRTTGERAPMEPGRQHGCMAQTSEAALLDRSSELALLDRCRKGDATAFGPIVRAYEAPLLRLLIHISGDAEEARDLAQETFLRAWRRLATYDPARSFRNWLFAVARNLHRDLCRHRRTIPTRATLATERTSQLPDPGPSPENVLMAKERRERVWRALERLSPSERQILILKEIEDLRYADIAQILGIPEGTVASRIYHARRALREIWEAESPQDRESRSQEAPAA